MGQPGFGHRSEEIHLHIDGRTRETQGGEFLHPEEESLLFKLLYVIVWTTRRVFFGNSCGAPSTNTSLRFNAEHLLCFCFCILIGFVGDVVQAPDQVLEGAVRTKEHLEKKIIETASLEKALKIIQSHQ